MKNDFLSELIDELTKLRDEQAKITIPMPPKPDAVFKTIAKVAREHEFSAEDMMVALSVRSMMGSDSSVTTAAEMQLLHEIKNTEDESLAVESK